MTSQSWPRVLGCLVAALVLQSIGLIGPPAASAGGPLSFDLETGVVTAGSNNVRIPGEGGTRFSLTDDLKTDARAFLRLRASYRLAPRHEITALYAPLTLKASGQVERPLTFEDVTFAPATPLEATYTFNSYRLTYRRTVHQSPRLMLAVGFTAKIRDAAIAVRGGGHCARKTNVGFVPLLNFAVDWRLGPRVGLSAEGDALAAPQGRAEDVQAGVYWALKPGLTLRAGYRVLEGGADNAEVYNFALLHYAMVGVTLAL